MDFTHIIELDRQLLLALNGSGSLFLDGLVMTLTTAYTWVPLYCALFYLVLKNNDSAQKIILIVVCAALCAFVAGSLDDMVVKPLVARWRPTHDEVIGRAVDVVNGYRGGRFGFFSAHASNTFSIAIFFTLLVRSRALSIALILWSLTNCWTRLYLGVHFPGDILCGLLWGGTVGSVVYYFYLRMLRRFSSPPSYISMQYTSTGYLRSDVNVVVCVLVLLLLYAQFRGCLMLLAS